MIALSNVYVVETGVSNKFDERPTSMTRKQSHRGSRGKSRGGTRQRDPAQLWQTAVGAYQRGNPGKARRALKPLLEHPAADANTFLLAGLAEAQLEELPRAVQLLEKAAKKSPEITEAWLSLGNVLHAQGRMDEASNAFKEAARRAPGNAQAWNNLGVVNEDMGRTRDALDYYNRALEIEPDFGNALRRRAPVLGRLRWFEAAREAYQDLLRRYPGDQNLRVEFARFLEQANRPEKAEEILSESGLVENHAMDATVEYLRAQLLIRKGDLETALSGLRGARTRTGEDFLSYREGLILDRLGLYDDAMTAFQRANKARAQQKSYKRLLSQPVTDYLRYKIEAGVQAPDPSEREPSKGERTLVFVTGLPRSGTTLLDRMLAAHPDIQVLEELEALRMGEAALAEGADAEEARRMYWDFVTRHVALGPEATIVDKNPMHVMHLDVIPRLFPRARVVYMLRHPYDAALSCFMQDFDPGPVTVRFLELGSTASLCAQFLALMRNYESACPDRVTRVHYEDLVANFQDEVKRVLEAMGLGWHEGIEDYAGIAARSAPIMTASYEQVTRRLYRTSLQRWWHYEQWLAPFHDQLGEMLAEFGYQR